MALTSHQQQILQEARERARRLVKELEEKAAELEKCPPGIPPQQLEEGRMALRDAVAAVRKALENIEKAAEAADNESRIGRE